MFSPLPETALGGPACDESHTLHNVVIFQRTFCILYATCTENRLRARRFAVPTSFLTLRKTDNMADARGALVPHI